MNNHSATPNLPKATKIPTQPNQPIAGGPFLRRVVLGLSLPQTKPEVSLFPLNT
jgi:hypothetical protein